MGLIFIKLQRIIPSFGHLGLGNSVGVLSSFPLDALVNSSFPEDNFDLAQGQDSPVCAFVHISHPRDLNSPPPPPPPYIKPNSHSLFLNTSFFPTNSDFIFLLVEEEKETFFKRHLGASKE